MPPVSWRLLTPKRASWNSHADAGRARMGERIVAGAGWHSPAQTAIAVSWGCGSEGVALAALIAAVREAEDGSGLVGTLPVAGRTLIERQARLAARVGA